jgi:hypothetical protein
VIWRNRLQDIAHREGKAECSGCKVAAQCVGHEIWTCGSWRKCDWWKTVAKQPSKASSRHQFGRGDYMPPVRVEGTAAFIDLALGEQSTASTRPRDQAPTHRTPIPGFPTWRDYPRSTLLSIFWLLTIILIVWGVYWWDWQTEIFMKSGLMRPKIYWWIVNNIDLVSAVLSILAHCCIIHHGRSFGGACCYIKKTWQPRCVVTFYIFL